MQNLDDLNDVTTLTAVDILKISMYSAMVDAMTEKELREYVNGLYVYDIARTKLVSRLLFNDPFNNFNESYNDATKAMYNSDEMERRDVDGQEFPDW